MYTNEEGIELPLAVWLAADEYDHNSDPKAISATTLLNPIKSLLLQNRMNGALDSEVDVDILSQVPSRMGTALHDSIERAWIDPELRVASLKKLGYPEAMVKQIQINPTNPKEGIPIYMEQRWFKDLKDYVISGKVDFVMEGVVQDFKSTGTYTWLNVKDKTDDYIKQGSIYRWLRPDIITEDYMKIHFIFTNWSKLEATKSKDYPQSRLRTIKLNLMSIPETEAFIQSILNKLDTLKDATQEHMPRCTDKELWRSKFVWKYYKDPNKRTRSTKNFDNESDAYMRYVNEGSKGIVVRTGGDVKRCNYCDARNMCDQAKEYIK